MPTIKFTDITGLVPEPFYPQPAKFHVPEWLQKLPPYHNDGGNPQTAKRCMPMLDAVMSGYTIVLTEDLEVTERDEKPYYKWAEGLGIEWHGVAQASTHPKVTNAPIAKWLNPWSIETPHGYSCLFVSPLNSEGLPVKPFAGIVDTDSYISPVNFPFLLSPLNYQGTIEAGTPIVQVIPFQREEWVSEFHSGTTDSIRRAERFILSKFKGVYRNFMRKPRSFR